MALVLDTGALIALDRGERRLAALMLEVLHDEESIVTSSGCVAQAWRASGSRDARLAMSLRGVDQVAIDTSNSRAIGQLCTRSGIDDIVHAHVANLVGVGDIVATSDGADIETLLNAREVRATIVRC